MQNVAQKSNMPPLEPGDHLSRAEFERRYNAHPKIKNAELIKGVVYMPSPYRIKTKKQPPLKIKPHETVPPLEPGDHLSQTEFERRYKAHPEIKKADLIKGVVYMPSPVRLKSHGIPHKNLVGWIFHYEMKTPGLFSGDNCTVILGANNEVQPDIFLAKEDGPAFINADDYLEGPPELVVEIAASSASYDLHVKKQLYTEHGVAEYLVAQTHEQRLDWFVLRAGQYEALPPDEHGLLHSEAFPGLRLNVAAFWAGDLARLVGAG